MNLGKTKEKISILKMQKNIQEESLLKRKPQTTESAIVNCFGPPRPEGVFDSTGLRKIAKRLRDGKRKSN
jgi:hypothetical protein